MSGQMVLANVCDWLVWDDLFVVGIAADIAGVWMLASSFATKRPSTLAEELVAVTRNTCRENPTWTLTREV